MREAVAAWLIANDDANAAGEIIGGLRFATGFLSQHRNADHAGDCPHVKNPVPVTCSRCVCDDRLARADAFISGPIASEIARLTGERDAAVGKERDWIEALLLAQEARIAAEADLTRMRAETERLAEDAERFRALMRCGRIKPQGSCGVNTKTGERTYPDQPGSVHFGAEFWVAPEAEPSNLTIWGRHCLRALADDIIAFEVRAALSNPEQTDA